MKSNFLKRLAIIAIAATMSVGANAQMEGGRFGIRAGANFTNLASNADFSGLGLSMTNKMKPGFQLGVVADIPTTMKGISFETGLLFAQQGAKWEGAGTYRYMGIPIDLNVDVKMALSYFQLPYNIKYTHDLGNDIKLLLQGGLYLGYALSGKLKVEVGGASGSASATEKQEEKLEIGIDEDKNHIRFLDLGLGVGAGLLLMDNIQVNLGYNLGVTNVSFGDKLRNRGLAFTVTYFIN